MAYPMQFSVPGWYMRTRDFEDRLELWLSPTLRRVRSCWIPAADVYREKKGWLIKVELAGVRKSDLEVRFAGQQLMISGVRRDDVARLSGDTHALEIEYDRFERAIDLAGHIQAEAISKSRLSIDYRDGMLLVQVTYEQR